MNRLNHLPAEHGEAVWRTIYRLLGNPEGAADCFQDTFVQYVRISRGQNVRQPLGLLKRIATARAVDEIRRRVLDRGRTQPLDPLQPSANGEPWQSASAQELSDNLRDALSEIPPDQASVFCMTQLEGMERKETAAAMGINAQHVSVLLHRARSNLQERLVKYLPSNRR